MTETKTGKQVFEEKKAELMKQVKSEREQAKVSLLQISDELRAKFKRTANLGTENVQIAGMPYLKVTEANSRNEMLDGKFAPAGTFFFQPTKEVFKELEVSIMHISKGFYSRVPDKNGQFTDERGEKYSVKFNQLLAGMMLDQDSPIPFAMFCSGTRWKRMIDFVKELAIFTKDKENPIPLYAFRVNMNLEEITTENGRNHVVNYTLVRNGEGIIEIVSDDALTDMLIEGVEKFKQSFSDFIDANEVDKETGEYVSRGTRTVQPVDRVTEVAEVDTEAIPF